MLCAVGMNIGGVNGSPAGVGVFPVQIVEVAKIKMIQFVPEEGKACS
jgi:hypothetical protein